MHVTTSPVAVPPVPFGPGSADSRWCAVCVDERVFDVPPCEDGHGEDCLDLACTECGHAIVVGIAVVTVHAPLQVRAA